jgi:MFS family permease
MSWELKTIRPKRSPAADRRRWPSPALSRFLAGMGFSVFGISSLKVAMKLFGFDSNAWFAPVWSSQFMFLVIGSLVIGFIGGLSCLWVGMQVDVRSDSTNYVIAVFWHYLANGTLILMFLLGLVLSKNFDKEGIRKFVLDFGAERMSLYTLAISAVGSLVIAAVLFWTGLLKDNQKPHLMPCIAVTLPVGLATSYTLFAVLGIGSRDWILIGLVFSTVLVLISAYMIDRDRVARQRLIHQ